MAIVYRTAGGWGAGKGSNLTPAEVDGNFYDLDTRLTEVENNPPTAVSINHFVVEGTLLTIVMSDGSEHGPFVLPVAQWRWTGDWQPDVQYFVGDIVVESGNVYFVRVQHVSDVTFDPGLTTVDGQVYVLLLSKTAQPYDVGFYYNDFVPAGDTIIAEHLAVRDFTLSANFSGSKAFLNSATSVTTITLPIYKNGAVVGNLQFTPGNQTVGDGQFGNFSTLDPDAGVSLVAGDRLSIGLPYEDDPTAAGLVATLTGIVAAV